jgi:tRNA threonylcarbamoyladenosine biosynthesis protein TsaE
LLKAPAVIELRSDLGGGKTTFVRGLARGIGSRDKVSSPTFTLSKVYRSARLEIHHFDFYRLQQPGILSDYLIESLQSQHVITVVEWGNVVEGALPKERIIIEFTPVSHNMNERHISIKYTPEESDLIKTLETKWENIKP